VKAIRENGVVLFFFVLTLLCIAGEAISGYRVEVDELKQHGESSENFWTYLVSPTFGSHMLENWQSEFLQFATFIAATIWLVQLGSAEAKSPGDEGFEDNAPAGVLARVYGHSLLLVMTALFLLTWGAQSASSWREFNAEELMHGEGAIGWSSYIGTSDFWERTFQNWQSEFLAVSAMAIFTVFLRQRGSSESKRIDTPHEANEPTY
jgi:hypothetical protein